MSRVGENIYRRKDGRYEARYIKQRSPSGKPIYGYIYADSYRQVKIRLSSCVPSGEREELPPILFCGILEKYLVTLRKKELRASTFDNYDRIVRNHLMPLLGHYDAHEINSDTLQKFLRNMRAKHLEESTIRNAYRLLSQIFRNAVDEELLYENPCSRIVLPKRAKRKVIALTRGQQQRLEQAAVHTMSSDKHGLGILIALHTGMRLGEICALRWTDVDLESKIIHVNFSLGRRQCSTRSRSKTDLLLGPPKSSSSVREIPITEFLMSLLLLEQKQSESCYIIHNKHKRCVEPRLLQYWFQKLLATAGLPKIGFHVLRHSFATRCMELSIDITTISKLLGHSSVKLTLDIYTDSLMEQRRHAIRKLGELSDQFL